MRNLGCFLVLLWLVAPVYGQSVAEQRMKQAAQRIEALLNKYEDDGLQWFSPDFFKGVPQEKLIDVLKQCGQLLEKVERVRIRQMPDPWSAELEFIGKDDRRLRVMVRLETSLPHRFNYVLFGLVDMADDTWEKLNEDLQKLPGVHGVTIWKLTPIVSTVFSRQSTAPLAIGSSFKLLILSLLCEEISSGKRQWSDVVTLQEAGRSLPSGLLQGWPVGSPVTLHTLAIMMLTRSDNTAADHLMLTLGRQAIEEHLKTTRVQFPERNRPFLRTSELFKLKLVMTPQEAQTYAELSEQEKRRSLDEIDKKPLSSPRTPDVPRMIEKIEWFFTTDDLARLLQRIHQSPQQTTVLPLLAITRPFDIDDHAWNYLGFKGGAEVGVLNLSLLGQLRKTSDWYIFSFTLNDPKQAVNEAAWIQQVERSLRLIERGKK